MIARCTNEKHPRYADYGGCGITVCQEWRDSFHAFLSDMGEKPTAKHTIERINNGQGYSPSNCCWATKAEQNRNTKANNMLTHNGKTFNLCEWARITGIEYRTISTRLKRGWTVQEALTITVSRRNKIKSLRQSMSGID